MTLSNRLLALKARAALLRPDLVPFIAADILHKAERYGDVTDKQHAYVDSLLRKVEPRPDAPPVRLGPAGVRVDLARINRMFDTAAAQLKRPFVIFATYKPDPTDPTGRKQIVDQEFRISQAPATGKNPGCLYVKQGGTYVGKIGRDGRFAAAKDAPQDILGALQDFAIDPGAAAVAYGQATGACCFCSRELTDARSVEAGYGPICASRWGLPWGVESFTVTPICEEVA